MKILCTFSGKFGDILWSLPTVKAISEKATKELENLEDIHSVLTGCFVDFGIMPQYESLLPLLNAQDYISKAFVIKNWECTGSPHGDQPWNPPYSILVDDIYYATEDPVEGRTLYYDKVYHLTYRNHPGKNEPLVDFIAKQQGITLSHPIPFISVPGFTCVDAELLALKNILDSMKVIPTIAYSFNESMIESKLQFLEEVKSRLLASEIGIQFIDVSKLNWLHASYVINHSLAFIGCRSSNYVLACGLGKKVFVFEPNVSRSRFGSWGTTFTCPYADETEINYTSIYQLVDYIKSKIVEVIK